MYIYIYPLGFGLPATVPQLGLVVLRCTVGCLAKRLPFSLRHGTLAKSDIDLLPGTFEKQDGMLSKF